MIRGALCEKDYEAWRVWPWSVMGELEMTGQYGTALENNLFILPRHQQDGEHY